MKAYAVTHGKNLCYAGTMAEARERKYKMNEAAGLARTAYTKDAAQIEEIEIPTSKNELLSFLNDKIDNGWFPSE